MDPSKLFVFLLMTLFVISIAKPSNVASGDDSSDSDDDSDDSNENENIFSTTTRLPSAHNSGTFEVIKSAFARLLHVI
ncbi:hypothetical protein QR680_000980 [Steinernema hermaphroditum]|uniref:Uncharacterized protein n=1 Tax=Steinernema hermaphroditum TaxID=289476 RepID=A0AA39GXB3_9BILA|nr:hypothetical protein QR680_000980 [Steinernema hermaphroditum]